MKLTPLHIPITPDYVLSPKVYYAEGETGIYFETEEENFGRITFYNLDSIKVCRGEALPYSYENLTEGMVWAFKVLGSEWLTERYNYEHQHYGDSYNFNGNVDEMLVDYSHYLFSFHDQFVEVIAGGLWYEENTESLIGRKLTNGHPFLPLLDDFPQVIAAYNLTCLVRSNKNEIKQLTLNAELCPQKLFEFVLDIDSSASVSHTLLLRFRHGRLISSLVDFFGNEIIEFEGIANLERVKPYIEKHMSDVAERRKEKGK